MAYNGMYNQQKETSSCQTRGSTLGLIQEGLVPRLAHSLSLPGVAAGPLAMDKGNLILNIFRPGWWFSIPLKNMKVNWDAYSQYMGK